MRQIFLLCLMLFASVAANAHSIGRSSSYWHLSDGGVKVDWNLSGAEAEALVADKLAEGMSLNAALSQYASKVMNITAEEQCSVEVEQVRIKANGDYVVSLGAPNCAASSASLSYLFESAPSHVHLAHMANGESLLSVGKPILEFGGGAISASPVEYGGLGVFHILEGFDHLAFLLALLIAVRTVKALFWCVTGFTLGHSLTLILGSLGVLDPIPEVVEPLIAFTIAFTVIERALHVAEKPGKVFAGALIFVGALAVADYLLLQTLPLLVWAGIGLLSYCVWGAAMEAEEKQPRYMLPIVTLGFGLLHGFGFYGVLSEIGLPQTDTIWALLGFNVGVEIGQLIFLGAALTVVWMLDKLMKEARPVLELATSVGLVMIGMFWFAERVYLG